MIKLTKKNGGSAYINPSSISSFALNQYGTNTVLYMLGDSMPWEIKETPEEIIQLINKG